MAADIIDLPTAAKEPVPPPPRHHGPYPKGVGVIPAAVLRKKRRLASLEASLSAIRKEQEPPPHDEHAQPEAEPRSWNNTPCSEWDTLDDGELLHFVYLAIIKHRERLGKHLLDDGLEGWAVRLLRERAAKRCSRQGE